MSASILVIGNKNYSSWSLRAWLAAKHAHVDFEEIRVPLHTQGYKEKILRHSPAGKVPIYKDDGVVVWESLAICEYLAEKSGSLWPAKPAARAMARAISAEMHAGFSALRNALPMNCRAKGRKVDISQDVVKDIRRIMEMWNTCRRSYGAAGPWLFGEFSVADAMYAPVASRFVTYSVECDDVSSAYVATVMSDKHVEQWLGGAASEKEVIEAEEVGRP
jgi:glutathione S-transferase